MRALEVDPGLATAHRALAAALEQAGDPLRALAVYDAFLERNPTDVDAWSARGTLLLAQGRAAAAIESFDRALTGRPGEPDLLTRKALGLLLLERAAEALVCADAALDARPDDAPALNAKAGALARLQRPLEALECFERALDLEPRFVEVWCNLAAVHHNLGDSAGAAQAYRRALDVDPTCMTARTGLLAALVPPVPASSADAQRARAEFDGELSTFEEWLRDRRLGEPDIWTVARQPFFYLSYEESDHKTLLTRYRSASAARVALLTNERAAGDAARPMPVDAAPRRLRLGIVSAHVYDHPVYTAIMQGWLRRFPPGTVELSIFSLGAKRDAVTAAAAAAVEHFEGEARGPADWSRLIRERRLDAVIFPEVGMDRNALALAHQRLAPLQLAAWGHPETTGLPTIDAFVSADALEPPDAAEHYSERLLRLPNLGVHYEPLAVTPVRFEWTDHGAQDVMAGPVFICAGTPYKYAPADDAVLVDIARALGRCRFVFFTHERANLSRRLGERLAAAFAAAGLDAARYLTWLPWLPRAQFFGMLQRADVYLDTLRFSGFNTLLQAVQTNLPCVALEGRFLRGRLGSGVLRTLGLPECVAATRGDYVAAAVRLGEDAAWRAAVRRRMARAEASLYADKRPIDALLDILTGWKA